VNTSLPLAHRVTVASENRRRAGRVIARAAGAVLCAAFGVGVIGLVGGCADTITTTRDSQNRGLALYSDGNYADAAGAFRNTVRANPKDYQSLFYLGQSQE